MIDTYRLQSVFITRQSLVMQRMKPEQILYFINRVKNIHHSDVAADNLRLKPMFLVTRFALIIEFSKIFLVQK